MSNAGNWAALWAKELEILEKEWKKLNSGFDAKAMLGNFRKIEKPLKNLDQFVTSLSMARKEDQGTYIKPLDKHVQDVVVPLKKALKPLEKAAKSDPAKAKIKPVHARFEKYAVSVIDEAEFEVERLKAAEKRMSMAQAAQAKNLAKAQKQGELVLKNVDKLGDQTIKANKAADFNKNLKTTVTLVANWSKMVAGLIPNKRDAAKLTKLREMYIKTCMPRTLSYEISEEDLKSEVEDLKTHSKELVTKAQKFKNA